MGLIICHNYQSIKKYKGFRLISPWPLAIQILLRLSFVQKLKSPKILNKGQTFELHINLQNSDVTFYLVFFYF